MSSGATYIAVIIVLVILIGFVLTMVNLLASTTGSKIRSDMQRVISTYNAVIETKAREIEKLNQDRMAMVQNGKYTYSSEGYGKNKDMVPAGSYNTGIYNPSDDNNQYIPISSFIIPSVQYRSSVLADNYEEIKNDFAFSDKKIRENVEKVSKNLKDSSLVKACESILEGLSFDGIYELSTRKGAEQVDFLKNNLHKKDLEALITYLDIIEDENKFDAIRFCDWLKRTIKENSSEVEVRSSSSKNVDEFDSSICDGYRLYVGNKMYDYAISKKDVS